MTFDGSLPYNPLGGGGGSVLPQIPPLPPLAFVHHQTKNGIEQRMANRNNKRPNPLSLTRNTFTVPSASNSSLRTRCGKVSSSCIIDPPQPRRRFIGPLFSSEYDDSDDAGFKDEEEYESEQEFLERELSKMEALEDLLTDVQDEYYEDADVDDLLIETKIDEDNTDAIENLKEAGIVVEEDIEDVEELFSLLLDDDEFDDDDDDDDDEGGEDTFFDEMDDFLPTTLELEKALLQGVVPVSADVGSEAVAGDWGFDPLNLATKDYIHEAQYLLLQALPGAEKAPPPEARPEALILRDYREAEIRHGRLAMLAAVFWPLQEMLDRLLLDVDQFGPLIYGPVTLPYFPLLMTLTMMLLGYLDIYANAIRERDEAGDAFLPGDCFWDPLQILEGAPATMKRNMQERELFNGRMAMLAFAAFVFEEATTHLPVIEIKGNELLFMPAYQIPYVQEWLDAQFLDSYN